MDKKIILAFVGMPGAGKSEAASYLDKKGIPFVRFGQFVEDGVKEKGLELSTENERKVREEMRRELGMGAMAIKAKDKLKELLERSEVIAIDGLYSWEEYIILKRDFPALELIHIYAEPQKRYERLSKRKVRPVSFKAYERDVSELEKLNKGGPIAIADHLIENNSDDIADLYKGIDSLLSRLGIKV